MIFHLIKLIWKRKTKNSLLAFELLLSFIVVFAITTMFIDAIYSYNQPLGYDYKNVWHVNFEWNEEKEETVRPKLEQIYNVLKSNHKIESIATSASMIPYSQSASMTSLKNEAGNSIQCYLFRTGEKFKDVLNLEVTEGRWFDKTDEVSNIIPVVINEKLKLKYFGEGNAVGKTISRSETTWKVIGVIANYKYYGEFDEEFNCLFRRNDFKDSHIYSLNNFLFKVGANTEVNFEEELHKTIASISRGWKFEISTLEDYRRDMFNKEYLSLGIPAVIALFLILNVALGLIGVIWYNINTRKSEIGLRRAIGAAASAIIKQIITETLILGTFALIGGIILAIQVPVLELIPIPMLIFIMAIIMASILIYSIIVVCSMYPSFIASKIKPATALHED